jgi:hypothetical protein
MGMENIEKRYERRGSIRPCSLDKNDLLHLSAIIQETFTKAEIERYFRVSTNLGNTRVFSSSVEDFLNQKEFPDQVTDLSFWIEGWDQKTRFDKVVLLDFSKYSIQVSVEGIDPVWVYDKYTKITKFLKSKLAWYWPLIILEKFVIFAMTLLLISNIIISIKLGEVVYYLDKIVLLGIWTFLIFYDTRKIWPYANLRIKGNKSILNKENLMMFFLLAVLVWIVIEGTVRPFLR